MATMSFPKNKEDWSKLGENLAEMFKIPQKRQKNVPFSSLDDEESGHNNLSAATASQNYPLEHSYMSAYPEQPGRLPIIDVSQHQPCPGVIRVGEHPIVSSLNASGNRLPASTIPNNGVAGARGCAAYRQFDTPYQRNTLHTGHSGSGSFARQSPYVWGTGLVPTPYMTVEQHRQSQLHLGEKDPGDIYGPVARGPLGQPLASTHNVAASCYADPYVRGGVAPSECHADGIVKTESLGAPMDPNMNLFLNSPPPRAPIGACEQSIDTLLPLNWRSGQPNVCRPLDECQTTDDLWDHFSINRDNYTNYITAGYALNRFSVSDSARTPGRTTPKGVINMDLRCPPAIYLSKPGPFNNTDQMVSAYAEATGCWPVDD